jgi:integrase/recombinase XerD
MELEQLQVSDLNLSEGTIYIRSTAHANSRQLGLKPSQILLFHYYLTHVRVGLLRGMGRKYTYEPTGSLLIGGRGKPWPREDISKHVLRRYKGWYAPRKITAERIRQSVIANLLSSGQDLRVVQVFAGHRNLSTTERYKQSQVDTLQTAINRLHPMA